MVHPTIRTLPLPDTQRHFLNNMPAVFASFRAGKPAVNFYQFPTVPLAFIGKLSGQFTPTSVRNSLCQFAVQDHIFDSQILNYYRLVFAHQLSCQLVQKIFASIGYLPVYFGCFKSRLVPVVACFLFPRQGFLRPPQLLVHPLKVFGVSNLIAVTRSNQTGEPNVQTNCFIGFELRFDGRVIYQQGDKPSSLCIQFDRNGGWIASRSDLPAPPNRQRFGAFSQKYLRVFPPESRRE
jgi:hypothetical protein